MRYHSEAIMGCTKLTGPGPTEDPAILLLKLLTPSKQILRSVSGRRQIEASCSVNATLTWTATLNLLFNRNTKNQIYKKFFKLLGRGAENEHNKKYNCAEKLMLSEYVYICITTFMYWIPRMTV
jgi:hypothetical protein